MGRAVSRDAAAPGDTLRWEPIRYFVAVARAGSVMAAARQLGVGHATVLRNVARLEAGLGLRLFDHVRTGYRLTADGEDVLDNALAMEAQAEALLRRALGKNPEPEGRLKLVLADASLFDPMPLLEGFRRATPRIELAIEDVGDAADSQLAALHADAAIQVTNTPPDELVGRQLSRVRFGWFASPAYLASLAGPVAADAVEWVIWQGAAATGLGDRWQERALHRLTGRPRIALRAGRHAEAQAAVRAGLGAGLLSTAAAADLEALPFADAGIVAGVWLLTHPDLRRSGRVQALFDFVADRVHGELAGAG